MSKHVVQQEKRRLTVLPLGLVVPLRGDTFLFLRLLLCLRFLQHLVLRLGLAIDIRVRKTRGLIVNETRQRFNELGVALLTVEGSALKDANRAQLCEC